jgi:hypothetical protein
LEEDSNDSEEGLNSGEEPSRFRSGVLIDKKERSSKQARHSQAKDDEGEEGDVGSSLGCKIDKT